MKIQSLFAAAALSLSVTAASQASIVFDIEETGSDVIASFSGSFDLEGSDLFFTGSFDAAGIASGAGVVVFGTAAYDFYAFTPLTFGTDISGVIGTHTGDNLFVWGQLGVIAFETGYAGEEISGSLTFGSQSFEDLGLTDGESFVFAGATDTLEVNIGSAIPTVPVPAGLLLMGTALAGLGMARRKG